MSGIDPNAYMRQVSVRLTELTGRTEIEAVLDEMENLFEVVPPELQNEAGQIVALLRRKLAVAGPD